jgi:hypothetical protein
MRGWAADKRPRAASPSRQLDDKIIQSLAMATGKRTGKSEIQTGSLATYGKTMYISEQLLWSGDLLNRDIFTKKP